MKEYSTFSRSPELCFTIKCCSVSYPGHSFFGEGSYPSAKWYSWCILNPTDYFEQILEAAPYKTATVRPLTSHLTVYLRRTRYAGHFWRSKDEHISNVLLWTSTQGLAGAGKPAKTYIHQPCADTERSLEDLPGEMEDMTESERIKGLLAISMTWWGFRKKRIIPWLFLIKTASLIRHVE